MIDKFTLAAIYISTISLFTAIDPNLLLCSLLLMTWYGMNEFVQLRSRILFQDTLFLQQYKPMFTEGNVAETENILQPKSDLFPPSEIAEKDQWQFITRNAFACSFCVLSFFLHYTNNTVPFAILTTYTALGATIIVSLILGTMSNFLDAGERDITAQAYRKEDLLAIGMDFLGILWIGVALSMVYNIACVSKGFALMVLLSCWLSEAGEYVMRKVYRGNIHFQTVTPSRTLEGLVMSILLCGTFGYFFKSLIYVPYRILGHYHTDLFLTNNTAYFFSVVCGVIAVLSMLGDLTISYMKRVAHVRFSSDMFFDFGGILDVFKGVCFSAVPMFALTQAF